MIEKDHKEVSIVRQCDLLEINRSNVYYHLVPESEENLELMRLIDEQHMETPFYGARQMMHHLNRLGFPVCRSRVGRLMKLMGVRAIYQHPRTSDPHPDHKVYPYLLRDLAIIHPNPNIS